MKTRFGLLALAVLSALPISAADYSVEGDHPRLLVPQRRLRLLRREQERATIRWNQFSGLVKTNIEFPEPGFAYSLAYIVSGDEPTGRKAVAWAASPAAKDLRQMAIVFDWCQPLLSKAESAALQAKLKAGLDGSAGNFSEHRDRLFAAIALAGEGGYDPSPVLEEIVDKWWPGVAGQIEAGKLVPAVSDHFPLYEMFHAVRDSLDVDLRDGASKYFVTLPVYHLLSHYPQPFAADDNDYHLPVTANPAAPPNVRDATLSRAAALSMAAFDVNSQETGFLQGWLMQDAYLMASPLGAPYEFLWANPYQPGLSYHYLPNIFHDPENGRLILRSSWDDDAGWFYQVPGARQTFRDGKAADIAKTPLASKLEYGNATILPASNGAFAVKAEDPHTYYLFGLQPATNYLIEIDDEELREATTDSGGVLEIAYPVGREAVGKLARQ